MPLHHAVERLARKRFSENRRLRSSAFDSGAFGIAGDEQYLLSRSNAQRRFRQLRAAEAGHDEIHQQQVEAVRLQEFDCPAAFLCLDDVMATCRESAFGSMVGLAAVAM